jgi:hypothetical protein
LFAVYSAASSLYHIQHVDRWYDHGRAEQRSFVELALQSEFCLCPHGYCSYTPRIAEVMALGRVPVVIADDWIPFSFDDAPEYYVRVAEKELDHLPDILQALRLRAGELGRNARALWEKYLAPDRRAAALVDCITRLAGRAQPKQAYATYREHWRSRSFLEKLGWLPHQRLALRAEQHLRRYAPFVSVPGVTPTMRYRNAPNFR